MTIEEAKLITASANFKIELPPDWSREKDREYYTECYDSDAGYDHALAKVIESSDDLNATICSAICFLHGAINPEVMEIVNAISFAERIKLLRGLIQQASLSSQQMIWITEDLAKCQTVESHRSRIVCAALACPEQPGWFYELQQLSDWLLTVDHDLQESMEQCEKYEDYTRVLAYQI